MSKWTASGLEAYIKAHGVINPDEGGGNLDWDDFVSEAAEGNWLLQNGHELLPVSSYRENEHYIHIFKIGDQYFRLMGEYDSWNGTTWDYAEIEEVKKKSVITETFVRA